MTLSRRSTDLVISQAGTDTLVYDQNTKLLHVLNEQISEVWMACDQARTKAEVAVMTGQTEEAVTTALELLASAGLMQGTERQAEDRRAFVKKAGVATGAILTVVAPAAARAGSGGGGGTSDPNQPED